MTKRRSRGDGGLHWNSERQRWIATASLGYDAVSLAVTLSQNPRGQRFTQPQLTRASGFSGVDGLFRLLSDGTSERGLAILEVRENGPRVLEPAPSSFSSAQY